MSERSSVPPHVVTSFAPHRLALSVQMLGISLIYFAACSARVLDTTSGEVTLEPIDSPPTQCEPFAFRWTGGTPPFFMHLIQLGGNLQRDLGPSSNSTFVWGTDFPAGTTVQARVSDPLVTSDTGHTFVVQSGPTSTCLGVQATTHTVSSSRTPVATPITSVGETSSSSDIPTTQSASRTQVTTTNSPSPHDPTPKASSSISTPINPVTSINSTTTTAVVGSPTPSSQAQTLPTPSTQTQAPTSYLTTPSNVGGHPTPSSPIPTSSRQFNRGTGAAVGVVVGICIAISVASMWLWYARRRRSRAMASLRGLFIVQHEGGAGGSRNLNLHRDTLISDGLGQRDQSVLIRDDVYTPENSSLVAHASSMYSGARDRNSNASRRDQRQGTDGMLMSEKILRKLRSQSISQTLTTREERTGMECTETDAMPEEAILSENWAENRRGRRRETDAGVRLVRGRAGEIAILEDLDQYSVSEGSTLPPAYSSDFGNR